MSNIRTIGTRSKTKVRLTCVLCFFILANNRGRIRKVENHTTTVDRNDQENKNQIVLPLLIYISKASTKGTTTDVDTVGA